MIKYKTEVRYHIKTIENGLILTPNNMHYSVDEFGYKSKEEAIKVLEENNDDGFILEEYARFIDWDAEKESK